MNVGDFKAISFDCYGTLIDWETGMIAALQPLSSKADKPLSRDEIRQAHARHESSQQAQTPTRLYRDVLATVYRRLAEEWRVAVTWEECMEYGRSIADWPAFADSTEALAYLAEHFRLIILSNVDNQSFEASRQKLQVPFDAIFTAEDIGSYKPARRNFHYLVAGLARLGVEKSDVLHTAESLFHDHVPASEFGLATCWIHRRHDQEGYGATMNPGAIPRVDFRFQSLADLAAAHEHELEHGG